MNRAPEPFGSARQPGRHGRPVRYLIGILVAAILAALACGALVFALVPAPVAAEYWVREMLIVKRHLAHLHSKRPKILVVAGSNVLFGVDAGLLSRELGVPVINFGLHGALPLEVLLEEAGRAALPGDAVVLPLEYPYFSGLVSYGPWQVRNDVAWNPDHWRQVPLSRRVAALATMGPGFVREVVQARWQAWRHAADLTPRLHALDDAAILDSLTRAPEPTALAYSAYALDAWGTLRNTEGRVFDGPAAPANLPVCLAPASRAQLAEFVQRSAARRIAVYFANTPWVDSGAVADGSLERADAALCSALADLAPVLDRRVDLVFPRELFLDTYLHLRTAGRERRTRVLLAGLRAHWPILGIDRLATGGGDPQP